MIRTLVAIALKIIGAGVALLGLVFAFAAAMEKSDVSTHVFMVMLTLSGLVIAAVGSVVMIAGGRIGRRKPGDATAAAVLSPEAQQLADSQEYLASRSSATDRQ